MKKKLLSIFLSLSLIFSSIASMSVSFAEENSSTEKVVQQDGIEVRMDMKAGSSFESYNPTDNPYSDEREYAEYFEGLNAEEEGDKAKLLKEEYKTRALQIMKIQIEIKKKPGLEVKEIKPVDYKEVVPTRIKNNYPDYFVMKESQDKYTYNYYFLENGEYKFEINYTLNGELKKTVVKYEAKDLVSIEDFYMRVYLIKHCKDQNGNHENKYLTKTFLATVLTQNAFGNKIGFSLGNNANSMDKYEKISLPKIESLDGIQYFTDNLKSIKLSGSYGFNRIKSISPITSGYYSSLDTFEVTAPGNLKPTILKESYTPELIGECVKKMPNLQAFYCTGTGFKDFSVFKEKYLKENNLDDIYCANNGVTSIDGIQTHRKLAHIGIHNYPIGKDRGLPQNGVFDLTPLKGCKLENKCYATLQDINIKEPVEKVINNKDSIKIELPMPIDINEELTDVGLIEITDNTVAPPISGIDDVKEKNIVRVKYDSKEEKYTAFKENGKVYINLNKEDFKNKFGKNIEEVLENLKFEFNFHNCRDEKIKEEKEKIDERTKGFFNGMVTFKATLNSPTKKGTVVYKFENRSDKYTDSDVDENVIDVEKLKIPERFVLPVDNTEYDIDREINPQNPTDKNNNKIEVGKEIVVKDEELNTYIGWTFKGYEPGKLSIKPGVNEIIGIWKAKDIEIVDYEFKSDSDKKLPQEVLDELVEPEKHYDGEEHIKPTNPEDTGIEVSDGVWRFIGWDKKEITEIHHDEHFIGVWHFEPKNTGGGTGGGGTITPTPNPNPTPDKEDPDRVEGDDRIETSIEASEILYPNGTNAVVLANAERFSDVLTANPFAVQEKASALLTYKDKLPEKTLKEIERLGAKKIYVSGGYEAVSKKVVDSLAAKGYEIYRFDGLDRYDTARKIAIKIREKGNKEVVELASGENYPDALCMTSMAVKDNAPILLTKKDSIPKYTKQALAEWDIENVKIGGLDEAISKDVQNQIDKGFEITKGNKADSNVYDGAKKVSRFGGKDRYETSTIIAANSYPESKLGVYATGEDFPDALIAGNYAGRKEAPVLLVKRDTLPKVVEKYTTYSKIEKATVIGGVNAVSDKVFNLIKAAINK